MWDFYGYLSVFLSQWWWFLTSGPYVLDPLLESTSQPYYRWKMRHFSEAKWRRLKIGLVFVGIFFAGFFAWKEEYTKHLASQSELAEAQEEIASLKAQPRIGEQEQAQINSLTQANEQLQKDYEVVKKDYEVVKRELERQASPWVLPDEQKRKLTEALNKVPLGVTYKLIIHVIPNCLQCSVYMTDLGETWVKIPGWQVQGGPNFTIDSRLIGVIVPANTEDCLPEELQLVTSAFDAAEIKYERGQPKGSLGPGCAVIVGSKPKE